MMGRVQRLGYVPAVDGLRATAIALVIGLHAFAWPMDGHMGVDLFFVLSGFLITTLLLEEKMATGRVSLRAFYARRARRLMPALVVLLVVFCLVAVISERHVGLALFSAASGLGFTMNVIRGFALHDVSNGLGHLWSLATEDQFYLAWPVLLFVLLRGRRVLGTAVLLIGLASMIGWSIHLFQHHVSSIRIELGPDTRATGLLIGGLVAMAYVTPAWTWVRLAARYSWPVALSFAALIVNGAWYDHAFVGVDSAFDGMCAVILVCALDVRSVVARALSLSPLVWIGRISYSLYLWHLPILDWTGWQAAGGVRGTAATALAVVAATLSYYGVEQRFRRRRVRAPGGKPVVPEVAPSRQLAPEPQ